MFLNTVKLQLKPHSCSPNSDYFVGSKLQSFRIAFWFCLVFISIKHIFILSYFHLILDPREQMQCISSLCLCCFRSRIAFWYVLCLVHSSFICYVFCQTILVLRATISQRKSSLSHCLLIVHSLVLRQEISISLQFVAM